MRRHAIENHAATRRPRGRAGVAIPLLMTLLLTVAATTPARAQAAPAGASAWRIGASTGSWIPLSAVIKAADSHHTRLAAGPAFAIEPQYVVSSGISLYANGTLAFSTIRLGSSIRPAVFGPSDQVMLASGTAGVMLTAAGWLGDVLEPTLRLGAGFKSYAFDLTGAENQVRPTADIGLGFRGMGMGPLEVTAEARYLPSSFDQSKLPTRGIATQDQRQTDLLFAIGVAIRP